MTSNQRRPGFRLPWSADDDPAAAGDAAPTNGSAPQAAEGAEAAHVAEPTPVAAGEAASEFEAPVSPAGATATPPSAEAGAASVPATPEPAEAAAPPDEPLPAAAFAGPESPTGFMRDLVAAMRRVAEETRQSSLAELRSKSEEQVRALEAETERRREELRMRAETDIEGVGEWARAEEERIKQEAEQKVVSRRAHLDQQLAAEMSRSQAETQALRDRVAAYERELDAYHAQLSDIADPAAFAAAAKRMPPPPQLGPTAPVDAAAPEAGAEGPTSDSSDAATATQPEASKEAGAPAAETGPANVSADASPGAQSQAPAAAPPGAEAAPEGAGATPTPTHETVATEVLVKGLGSFGAITGFRQALAGVEGIEGVSLSLGPTGEFVFRAIHPAGFDVGAAIKALEGDAAVIEDRAEGGLRVTLERAR